jgi:hypothetical protein
MRNLGDLGSATYQRVSAKAILIAFDEKMPPVGPRGPGL